MIPIASIRSHLTTFGGFTLPRTLARVTRILASDLASVTSITEEIAGDPMLVARVLGQANTAVSDPITALPLAVQSLGCGAVSALASNFTLIENDQRKPLAGCWSCANATAHMMQTMVEYRQTKLVRRPDEDTLRALGLLHDLGSAIGVIEWTSDYARACLRLKAGEGPLSQLLKEELGADTCEIGGFLAQAWNLPAPISTVMTHHQRPMDAPEHLDLVCLVHVARNLVRALGFNAPGDTVLDPIEERAVQVIGLGPIDLERILRRFLDNLDELEAYEATLLKSL